MVLSTPDLNPLSNQVIGAAIEVHRCLGPGLLESAYERSIWRELEIRGIPCRRQVDVPVTYKGIELGTHYRVDLIVDDRIIVELKAVDRLTAVHDAQLLTYLRLMNLRLGLLINFNVPALRHGVRRRVLKE